ncbi:MAG TPA: TonB-dependent receptor, partial [Steroidobacteraceae bacterium]|nr:TonB-dependent receptor [Steroidobacteraceae bacterium]
VLAVLSIAALPYGAALAEETSGDARASEEIIVTGSRIRGAAPVGLNVIGLEREDIESAQNLTTDRIIREVPQVYNLGVSDASRGQSGGAGNIVFGNAINLHGIGPYATLTLVDGHRPVTNSRSFDPSTIPSLGLERIEIVADGASAVYGSDAIAGVVNLVPRRNLNGFDTSLRYGDGNAYNEYQAGIAGGNVWSGGQLMVAFEHTYLSNLSGDDRSFFTSDQRPFGGGDYRVTRCNPGTLLVAAAATPTSPTGATPYAIPPGGVTAANAASLVAGTSNKCDLATGQDLLPQQKYNSLNATYTQRVNDWFELFADGFFSRREYIRKPAYASSAALLVPSTNAFFVSPPGTTTNEYVDYNFAGDFPRDTQTGISENWEVTPGLRFTLPGDFRLETLFTYGRSDDEANTTHGIGNGALNAALASNNPATAFDPFGLHRTSAATLAAIANQIFLAPTLTAFKGYEARVNGSLFHLPGGDVRIAAGYEGQRMAVALGLARGNPGTAIVYRNFDRNVDSEYAELLIPVVGSANAITAVNRLEFTAAVRYDKYSDVGTTTNPKFGLNWSPVESLKMRGSYGTSFRAP